MLGHFFLEIVGFHFRIFGVYALYTGVGSVEIASPEYAASSSAEKAGYKLSFLSKILAKLANPLVFREIEKPVALLVHRDAALRAEHYHIVILVVSLIANLADIGFVWHLSSFVHLFELVTVQDF